MVDTFKSFFLACCVLLGSLSQDIFATEQVPATDIAVLIDVSGSMKQNDPHNLRIPAVTLFINLLPVGTKAGIWLFAENTSVLIASGEVNAQWKKQALDAVAKIHSRGQFTHIETALQTATQAWLTKSLGEARNVLLLTDGVVDVAKDRQQNVASKQRILTELLPKIQQTGAHIQTIALSKQADSDLLKKLAFSTQGWSEMVESAQQLERIFLKMFKQAVPQDSVPLVGNKFKIDSSIKEFSVLVFRKPGTTTELLSADKQKITKESKSEQVHWMHEPHYDLMTIKNPVAGEWQILGEIDPDNQVMVLTDLKLNVNDVPIYKTGLTPLLFEAHFSDQQQLIDRDDFLNLINMHLQQTNSTGQLKEYPLQAVPNRKGYFQAIIAEPLAKERYTFKLLADGKTFTREITRNVAVIDSPVTLQSSVDPHKRQVTITLVPDTAVIDPATLTIKATIHQVMQPEGSLPVIKQGDAWQIILDAPPQGEQKVINFAATAKTKQGSTIEPELPPFLLDDHLFAPATHKPEPAKHAVEEKIAHPAPEHTETSHKTEEPPKSNAPDWPITLLITAAINIVFIALGFIGFRLQKQLAAKKQAHLLERLA
jgi:uncharacterized protein (TIGR03503 family)